MAKRKAAKGRTRPQPNPRIQELANGRAQLQRLDRAQREVRVLARRVERGQEATNADLLGMARRVATNAGLVVVKQEYIGQLQARLEELEHENTTLRAALTLAGAAATEAVPL